MTDVVTERRYSTFTPHIADIVMQRSDPSLTRIKGYKEVYLSDIQMYTGICL